jgi:hypothetical protein
MRKTFKNWSVPFALVLVAIGASWSATTATAQSAPWHIDQGSDGTLYLVTGDTQYVVNPDAISDDSLAALSDGGVLGSQLPPVPPVLVTEPVVPPAVIAAPTATPIPAPAPTSTPVPANTPIPATARPMAQPLTIASSGAQNTSPFSLAPGSYTINWSGTDPGGRFGGGSNLIVHVTPVDPSNRDSTSIVNVILKSGETQSGTTNAYNIQGGQYYLYVVTAGTWKVTFTTH